MSHARAYISVSRPPFREVGLRGGAHLRADRISYHIARRQAELILGAAYFAYCRGLPFNRWITINWSKAGIIDELAAESTRAFLKAAADSVKYWGGEFAASWVRENGLTHDHEPTGSHVHILAHIPPDLMKRFTNAQRGWLSRIRMSERHNRGTLRGKATGGYRALETGCPLYYAHNLHQLVSYQLKSALPNTLAALNLAKHHQHGGMILGKRCGTSQNIGRTAWKRAGIMPPRFWLPADLMADGVDQLNDIRL